MNTMNKLLITLLALNIVADIALASPHQYASTKSIQTPKCSQDDVLNWFDIVDVYQAMFDEQQEEIEALYGERKVLRKAVRVLKSKR